MTRVKPRFFWTAVPRQHQSGDLYVWSAILGDGHVNRIIAANKVSKRAAYFAAIQKLIDHGLPPASPRDWLIDHVESLLIKKAPCHLPSGIVDDKTCYLVELSLRDVSLCQIFPNHQDCQDD